MDRIWDMGSREIGTLGMGTRCDGVSDCKIRGVGAGTAQETPAGGSAALFAADGSAGCLVTNKEPDGRVAAGMIYMGEHVPIEKLRGFEPEGEDGRTAPDRLYDAIRNAGRPVDYVCLGPLTTVGLLLFLFPDVKQYLRAIYICPGEKGTDPEHPVSEENILADPVAARIVFQSAVDKVLLTDDTTERQIASAVRILEAPGAPSPSAERFPETSGAPSPSAGGSPAATVPATPKKIYATVQTEPGRTFGSLCLDLLDIWKRSPNTFLAGGAYAG